MVGWIGGSCAQPAVQREGLRALADGQPRLIRLSPEAGLLPPQEGVVEDVMTCHSGGTLEIYVEPFLPSPWLLVTGDSPIAEALASLGALADFQVRREPSAGSSERAGERYVVVAGMSGEDETDLERALALDPSYLAFVGSRKRLAEVAGRLRDRGVPAEKLDRIKGPAGLDIGAVVTDPVCGMEVAVAGARFTLEQDGEGFYFCCPACRRQFAANREAGC
jgi:xanthine dehydrogenase accessory factor